LELDGVLLSLFGKVLRHFDEFLPTCICDSVFSSKFSKWSFCPTGCAALNTFSLTITGLMHHKVGFTEHARILINTESTVLWALDTSTLIDLHSCFTLTSEITSTWSLDRLLVLVTFLLVTSVFLELHS